MPLRTPNNLDIPGGSAGLAAMAIVGGVAYTVGAFSFYGIEFLPYWHLIGGWTVGMTVVAAAFGTLAECFIWNGGTGRRLSLFSRWHPTHRGILAAGALAALATVYAVATRQAQCLMITAAPLGLIVFALATSLQHPILHALRRTGRTAVAVAVLLVLEAGLMFMIGQWLAIDAYRKGLDHFRNERQAEWPISGSGGADYHFDYARQEIVLRTRTRTGEPLEIRRSFVGFACN
jgi:hypothetical protein